MDIEHFKAHAKIRHSLTWTTLDRQKLTYPEIEDNHLENIIKHVIKRIEKIKEAGFGGAMSIKMIQKTNETLNKLYAEQGYREFIEIVPTAKVLYGLDSK